MTKIIKNTLNPLRPVLSDLKFITPCAFLVTIFSLLLFQELNANLSDTKGILAGTIIIKKNIALRKQNKQAFWQETSNQYPIYNLDTIRTGPDSSALLKLKDGTQIDIEENTLIIVDFTKKEANINVNQGSLRATRKEGANDINIPKLKLTSGNQTVSIIGGDIQLSKATGQDSIKLAVNKGKADFISAEGKIKSLGKNQKLDVSNNGNISIGTIPYQLSKPTDGKRIPIAQNRENVSFSWEKIESKANSAILEVSKTSNFSRIVFKNSTNNKSTAKTSLASGTYYWRIKDSKTKKDLSNTFKFSLFQTQFVRLQNPVNNGKTFYIHKPNLIHFSWKKSNLANSYRLEIAKDASFKDTILTKKIQSNQISYPLSKGQYFWRIYTLSDIEAAQKYSNVHKLTVENKLPDSIKIQTLNLKEKKIWRGNLKKGLRLSWIDNSDFGNMKVEISKTRDFKNIIKQAEVNTNYFTLEERLPIGKYYWRVQGVIPKILPSKANFFEITDKIGNNLQISSPTNKALYYTNTVKTKGVNFSWKAPKIQATYKLLVSKRKDFKTIYLEKDIAKPRVNIKDIRAGSYYWKVQIIATDNKEILGSTPAPFLFHIAPMEGIQLTDDSTIWGTSSSLKGNLLIIKSGDKSLKVPLSKVKQIEYDKEKED